MDYIAEIYELVGVNFPIRIVTDKAGRITEFSYDKNWKEGGTEAVESKPNKDGKIKINYIEKYIQRSLTKAQIKQIDEYFAKYLVD